MLSRVADALFWMSRYLERAEHVARAVDVCIVSIRRLVLNVGRRDRDTTSFFLGGIINAVERSHHHLRVVLRHHLRDRRRQCRLPVIHVTDRPYVHVRLRTVEFLFAHSLNTFSGN